MYSTLKIPQSTLAFVGLAFLLLISCDEKRDDDSPTSGSERKLPDRQKNLSSEERTAITSSVRREISRESLSFNTLEKQVKLLRDDELLKFLSEFYPTRNDSSEERGKFVVFVRELASRDPQAALGLFQGGEMKMGEAGWGDAMKAAALKDPELVKSWLSDNLASIRDGDLRSGVLTAGTTDLVRAVIKGILSPEDLLQFFQRTNTGILSGRTKVYALSGIFKQYYLQKPDEALRKAAETLKGSELDEALLMIADRVLSRSPEEAFKVADKINTHTQRQEAKATLYRKLLTKDPEGTLEKISTLQPTLLKEIFNGSGPNERTQLTRTLADTNPGKLMELVSSITVNEANKDVYRSTVESLALKNQLDLAYKLTASVPAGPLHEELRDRLFEKETAHDSEAALDKFTQLKTDEGRAQAFRAAGLQIAKKGGLKAVLETLNDSINETDKQDFLEKTITWVAFETPKEVADFIQSDNSLHLSPEARKSTLLQLGSTLTFDDPDSSKAWLNGLNETDQPIAMIGVAEALVQTDARALVDLLSELPKNQTWATGARAIIGSLARSDPSSAQKWQSALKEAGFEE
jgi:hypothetical protein